MDKNSLSSPAPNRDELSPSQTGSKSPQGPSRKRSMSGTGGLLSRIPFIRSRSSVEHARPRSRHSADDNEKQSTVHETLPDAPAVAAALLHPSAQEAHAQQQQRPRRRRGSLRKVVLLGRGAQRERRVLSIDTNFLDESGRAVKRVGVGVGVEVEVEAEVEAEVVAEVEVEVTSASPLAEADGNIPAGLGISEITPRPSMEGFAGRASAATSAVPRASEDAAPTATTASNGGDDSTHPSPPISYSTTDDEDGLHMTGSTARPDTASACSSSLSLLRPERASLSSGSDSFFAGTAYPRPMGVDSSVGTGSSLSMIKGNGGVGLGRAGPAVMSSIHRRRGTTTQRAKSPLALTSLSGLTSTPLPAPDLADWDYAETEFWGWVVLVVTWVVFVTGMGSCLGVWSWAWDVGTTPNAPPELSNDNSLPIVGYYPALMILTSVMAWVWVVVAWVGMKYFRHARVTGD